MRATWFLIPLLMAGCSGLEQSEHERIRRANAKGEYIYRNHDEFLYPIQTPRHRVRELYPWESALVGRYPKITKEFFRCKGSALHPPHADHRDPTRPINYFDCGGNQKHSLPLRHDKEFVYPILIDLLNYVQGKTGRRVVISCGHRCPIHNRYADSDPFNETSKHMIGAEVDFYVEGLEQRPEEVIVLLHQFYRETAPYKGKQEFEVFQRFDKSKTNVSIPPWYNQEIFIKLFKPNEGRDGDNRHPYPYICLQVRYDRDTHEKVIYQWEKAFKGYARQ